jgi:lysophospholipid acyltransferase (LPLAT)-like uncharacterized protein
MKEIILGKIVALFYRVYSWTFSYHIEHQSSFSRDDFIRKEVSAREGYLYAFWHQDELSFVPAFGKAHIVALVSYSKDGTIMASALRFFGYKVVRGSSSRGAAAGLIALMREVKNGFSGTMAVDGPRGPRYVAKEGMTRLAEKTGRPIIPARAFPRRYYEFKKSWSHAKLPLPFSRVDIVFGKPGFYSPEELSRALNELAVN